MSTLKQIIKKFTGNIKKTFKLIMGKNALISVSNKEGLNYLLKTLKKFNYNIISSGGTFKYIRNLGTNALRYLNIPALRKC